MVQDFLNRAMSDPRISAICGERVFLGLGGSDAELPRVAFDVENMEELGASMVSVRSGLTVSDFVIECRAAQSDARRELADAVETVMSELQGNASEGRIVRAIKIGGREDDTESPANGEESPTYLTRITGQMWIRDASV